MIAQRQGTSSIALAVVCAIALVLAGLLVLQMHVQEILRTARLADIKTDNLQVSLTLPKGKMFELLMSAPQRAEFQGRCEIYTSGALVATFPIGSSISSRCNWLDTETTEDAYILTWGREGDNTTYHTRKLLNSGRRYTFKLRYKVPPPKGSTLWLHWIQHSIDNPVTKSAQTRERERMHVTVGGNKSKE